MKKIIVILLTLITALSLLSACGKNNAKPDADTAVDSADTVTIMVNIKGMGGNIEVSQDGSDPVFDPEAPMQSAYLNVKKGDEVKILATPEEDYHFFKWTVDGVEYSTDPMITVTAEENIEYIAEFLPEGKDGKHVDLDTVTTLGELLGLPETETSASETTYIYAFEQDGNTYRAICDLTEEQSKALFDLEYDDPDYDKKHYDLTASLTVRVIENLTEGMPSQEEADKNIGKTGQELIDEGWTVHFYNLDELNFGMTYGIYSYDIKFEGEIKDPENFNEETDMGGLTVKTITCDGIGNASYMEEESAGD
ncbi:MAG: hypothetical protein IJT91_03135 [Clostridia bacterium]|nr:hypothetical protein [Clostridia bacterium]